jgi:hypothetical protein
MVGASRWVARFPFRFGWLKKVKLNVGGQDTLQRVKQAEEDQANVSGLQSFSDSLGDEAVASLQQLPRLFAVFRARRKRVGPFGQQGPVELVLFEQEIR